MAGAGRGVVVVVASRQKGSIPAGGFAGLMVMVRVRVIGAAVLIRDQGGARCMPVVRFLRSRIGRLGGC